MRLCARLLPVVALGHAQSVSPFTTFEASRISIRPWTGDVSSSTSSGNARSRWCPEGRPSPATGDFVSCRVPLSQWKGRHSSSGGSRWNGYPFSGRNRDGGISRPCARLPCRAGSPGRTVLELGDPDALLFEVPTGYRFIRGALPAIQATGTIPPESRDRRDILSVAYQGAAGFAGRTESA